MGCFRGRRSANTSTRWRCGIVCVAAPISETRSGSRPATVAMVGRKRTSSLGWAKALERQLVEWEYAVPLDVPFNRTAGFHRTCAWFLGEAAEQCSMMAANCLVHALVVRMTFERKAAGATLERTLGELDGLPETVISAAYHSSSPLREEMLRAWNAWTRWRRPSGGVPAGCSKPANSGTAEAWCLAVVPRGDAARPQEKKTPVDRSLRAEGVEAPGVEPGSGSRCVRRLRV